MLSQAVGSVRVPCRPPAGISIPNAISSDSFASYSRKHSPTVPPIGCKRQSITPLTGGGDWVGLDQCAYGERGTRKLPIRVFGWTTGHSEVGAIESIT